MEINSKKIQHIDIVDLETKQKANPERPKLCKQTANHKKIKVSCGSFFPISIQFSAFQCYQSIPWGTIVLSSLGSHISVPGNNNRQLSDAQENN